LNETEMSSKFAKIMTEMEPASPSSPFVRFTAFVKPIIVKTVKGSAIKPSESSYPKYVPTLSRVKPLKTMVAALAMSPN